MTNTLILLPAKTNNPKRIFSDYIDDSEYDIAFLCSQEKDKILKKDVDLDFSIFKDYKIICPIGAESLKYSCGLTGITKYNGTFYKEKYIPIIHPNLVNFRPQYKDEIVKAFTVVKKISNNEYVVETPDKHYEFVETVKDFLTYYEKYLLPAEKIVVDIEGTGLDFLKDSILGVAFSTKPHEGIYVSVDVIKLVIDKINELFKTRTAIFHNAKFDRKFLKHELKLEFPQWEDTMLLHYCLEESVGTHGLKSLAMRFTDLGDYEKELDDYKKTYCRKKGILLKNFSYGLLPREILPPYAMKDGDATSQIFTKFKPLVEKNPKFSNLYNNILKPVTDAIIFLEETGGPIGPTKLANLIEDYEIDLDECKAEISFDPAIERFERIHKKDFNPNSVAQLREVFFNILQLAPIKKTASGAWSTDAEVLKELDHPLAEAILDLRSKTKLLGTYLSNIERGLSADCRLRGNFNIHGTTSGRLSSSGFINYQNIPRDNKDIKKLFTARDGYEIIQCDLGTAEVYVAAILSDDPFLQEAFKQGLDFHGYVAKQMFNLPCEVADVKTLYPNERQYAKAITFGIMYQAGPAKIMEEVNSKAKSDDDMITFTQAQAFVRKYFNEAKKLKMFIDRSNDFITSNAYIYSFFGRKRRLPESRAANKGVARHAIRSGVNFLVQSVASDINLLGLIDLVDWIKQNHYEDKILPFTVVHDSIVAEVHKDLKEEYIEHTVKFLQKDRGIMIPKCPIKVDVEVGPSWGELSTWDVLSSAA